MFETVVFCTLAAQLCGAVVVRVTQGVGPFLRATFGVSSAAVAAFLLFVIAARIDAGQPLDSVGPEYGALVAVVGTIVSAGNVAVSLTLASFLLKVWPQHSSAVGASGTRAA